MTHEQVPLSGQAIRALRVTQGLTAKALAQQAGVSYQALRNIEQGQSYGSVAVVRRILHVLQADLSIVIRR